jgi:tetratricopeptide (TPR) repeat protein
MSWQDFEAFALEVVAELFEPHGIILNPTGAGPDGGRDAEGTLRIGSIADHAISLTLWVEVKQHRQTIGRQRVGGHIFAAISAAANVLVIVSGSGFSKNFHDDMDRFSHRTGIRYRLFDGRQLLEVATTLQDRLGSAASDIVHQQPRASFPTFTIESLCFSGTSSLKTRGGVGTLPVSMDTPVFAIVQFEFRSSQGCQDIELELFCDTPGISFEPITPRRIHRAGPVERMSSVFLVRAQSTGSLSARDVRLELRLSNLKSDHKTWEMAASASYVAGASVPRIEFLKPAIAYQPTRDQTRAQDGIAQLYDRWRADGGVQSFSIEAAAGVGKSSLLNASRWLWLKDGVQEVLLDGETEATVWSVFFAVFAHVLPVDTDLVSSFNVAAFSKWLKAAGVASPLATRLARNICSKDTLPNAFSPGELQDVLILLLRRIAVSGPVAFVFEDLHKVGGTVLRLLYSTRRALRGDRHCRILFCFTSRFLPQTEFEDSDPGAWSMERQRLLSDEHAHRHQLDLPGRDEAEAILYAAVNDLYPEMASEIIKRAGTTPFGLTEVVRYLRETGVLVFDAVTKRLALNHEADLRSALKDPALLRASATDQRIALITARLPEWARALVDLAACVGREFALASLLRHVPDQPAQQDVDTEMGQLVQNGILSATSRSSGFDWRFEHDLIREAALRHLAASGNRPRHLRLLEQLLSDGETWPEPVKLSLIYQSGRGPAFVKQARAHSTALAASGYPYEAAEYIALENMVLDSVTETTAVDDPAFRVVPRPSMGERTSLAALIEVKRRLYETLARVSGGAGETAQRLISEVRMLANKARDRRCAALTERWDGDLNIAAGDIGQALECFESAQALYQMEPESSGDNVFEAIMGQGIALRLLGQTDKSAELMAHALSINPGDARSQIRYHANYGALFFYTDRKLRRRHWQQALQIAKRSKLDDFIVHMELDLASLDILDDQLADASGRLERLIALTTERHQENSLMRALVMASCVDLVERWPDSALARLDEARRLGYAHDVGRRLWKIHTNSATAYEVKGDLDRAYQEDRRMLAVLKAVSWERRIALAPANLLLRSRSYPDDVRFQALVSAIPAEARAAAERILVAIDTGEPLSGQFPQEHYHDLQNHKRFVAI